MFIRKLTRDDLPAVIEITNAALKEDELFDWLYPYQDKYPDDMRQSHAYRLRARFVDRGSPGFVAVTEESDPDWTGTSEVVGYTLLRRTGYDEAAKEWQSDSLSNKVERYLISWEQSYEDHVFNRACDPLRLKALEKTRGYAFYSYLDPRWHLRMIMVSPKHQRRGIGQKLLDHAQEMARGENLPITLEASVMGRGLYAKVGFKVVDETEIAKGVHSVAMVWEPEGSKGRWLEDVGVGKANVLRPKST